MRMLAVVADCALVGERCALGVAGDFVVEVEIGGQEVVDLVGETVGEAMKQATEHMFVRYASGRMEVPKSAQESLQVRESPLGAETPESGMPR